MPRAAVVYVHQLKEGVCSNGHDLHDDQNLRRSGGQIICLLCRAELPRFCRRGLHLLPPSVDHRRTICRECKRATGRANLVAASHVLPLPPREVTDNAACSPATARLFDLKVDPQTTGRPASSERIEQAREICRHCPVALACLADAVEYRRIGVYGGVLLTPEWYKREAAAGRLPESAPTSRPPRPRLRSSSEGTVQPGGARARTGPVLAAALSHSVA